MQAGHTFTIYRKAMGQRIEGRNKGGNLSDGERGSEEQKKNAFLHFWKKRKECLAGIECHCCERMFGRDQISFCKKECCEESGLLDSLHGLQMYQDGPML